MWMSHGDKLHGVPDGFKAVGKMFKFVSYLELYNCLFVVYECGCICCMMRFEIMIEGKGNSRSGCDVFLHISCNCAV